MAEIKVGQSSYAKIQQLSRVHLLNSVRVYPEQVSFDGKDQDESIVLFLRQHPIILVPTLFRSILIFVFFMLLAWVFNTIIAEVKGYGAISFAVGVIGIAISITNIIYDFMKWYYTVTIVTSTRLVDLDFDSVMDSRWSTTVLRAIQDVSYNAPGFINTIFDMASLSILTAAHKENFELANLPKARDIQDIIMDLVENEKQNVPNDGDL
jgi:membrane protein YdbS with pleckstrin-like domain